MSELRQCETPHVLITVLLRDDQEELPGRAHNFAGDVEHVMADGLDRRALVLRRQDQLLEPRHQIEGQLADQQVSPVGMKVARGQFFQAEAVFVFFDQVLHIGVLQMPFEQLVGGRCFIIGHHHVIMEVQLMLLVFTQFALDDVAIGPRPWLWTIAELGRLRQFVLRQVLPLYFGNRRQRGQQRCGLIGRNAERDVARLAKGDDLSIVKAAIRPQFLGQVGGQAFQGRAQTPFALVRGVGTAAPQMTEDQFACFGVDACAYTLESTSNVQHVAV